MMADRTSMEHRLRFASPEVRTALGLPAYHVEDGRGGVAGHAPGHVYPAGAGHTPGSNYRDAAAAAYAKRSEWLSNAWKQAK
jgi:hypothetical protein